MNMKKFRFSNFLLGKRNIIFLIIFLILFSFIVNAGIWLQTGSDTVRSYVQDSGKTFVDENVSTSNINSDKTSLVEPLVADLDNDGLNEIIIFKSSEIRLYTGVEYNYESSYTSSNISIRGNAEVVDWDNDGNLELIFTTNTVGDNHSLYAMTYNGTWNLEKNIENIIEGNGLNCQVLWGDNEKCCYIGENGNFYCYDYTNSYNTSPIYTLNNVDCVSGSIPIYLDYNEDGILDVYFIYDITCNQLILLENNNDGTFTNVYNITTTNGINQIQKADLDGGVKELVITDSTFCSDNPSKCSPYSFLRIHNIVDGTENCKVEIPTTTPSVYSPYLTGLHTCYAQEGGLNCDYDGDGFNDIYILNVYMSYGSVSSKNSSLAVYDYNCDILNEIGVSVTNEMNALFDDSATTLYGKAVWGNFDADSQFELWVWNEIVNKDGSVVFNIRNSTEALNINMDSSYNFLILADVNGDSNNDLISQRNITLINVTSFIYDNQKPVITQVAWDTGSPICNNTVVNYEVSYTNLENDFTRVVYDCFNDDNILNGTLYLSSPALFSCLYDRVGNFETQIYLQDTADLTDFSVHTTYAVTVTVSEFCNEQGEQGGASNVTETGIIGGLDDWASKVPEALHEFGFKSTASKVFFGIFVIIGLIMVANEKYKNAFVSIVLGVLGTIALTYIGIFPIWLVFIIFVFASLLVYIAIFKFSSGSSGD